MKILCAYSGIEFTCEHFPGEFYSREIHHPIFSLPQKKLLAYARKWSAGELTPTDSYLLFLALLKSSDLIDFRVPVFRNEQTNSIVAQNMESLFITVIKLNTVSHPAVVFPRYVISPETRFLTNVHHWIQNWQESYQDFLNGCARDYDTRKLVQRESALERLIKNPHKNVSTYSSQLGEWAALAGSFPSFQVSTPLSTEKLSLSEYWKLIISRCAKKEFLHTIPKKDLQELLEHCEDHIPLGSIYSQKLFSVIRDAIEKQTNFLGLGDFDVKSTYQILSSEDSTESANLKALVDSAPLEFPRIEQYPTKFAFLKAKMRYQMAMKYAKAEPEEPKDPE